MNLIVILIGAMLIIGGVFTGNPFFIGSPITADAGLYDPKLQNIDIKIESLLLANGKLTGKYLITYEDTDEKFRGWLNVRTGYIPDGQAATCANKVQSLPGTNMPTFPELDLIYVSNFDKTKSEVRDVLLTPHGQTFVPTQSVRIITCVQMFEGTALPSGECDPEDYTCWFDPTIASTLYRLRSGEAVYQTKLLDPQADTSSPNTAIVELRLCDIVNPCNTHGTAVAHVMQTCEAREKETTCLNEGTALVDSGRMQVEIGHTVVLDADIIGTGEFVNWKCEQSCDGWSDTNADTYVTVKGEMIITAEFKSEAIASLSYIISDGQHLGSVEIEGTAESEIQVPFGETRKITIIPREITDNDNTRDYYHIYEIKVKEKINDVWEERLVDLTPDDKCAERVYEEISGDIPCGQVDGYSFDVRLKGDTIVDVKFGTFAVTINDPTCENVTNECPVPPNTAAVGLGLQIKPMYLVVVGVILLTLGLNSHSIPILGRRR